jgi:hypothetical protein
MLDDTGGLLELAALDAHTTAEPSQTTFFYDALNTTR